MFPSCDTHRPNLYYSKISKRKLKKEYAISSGTGENRTSKTVSSTLHLRGQAKYFIVLDRHKIKLEKIKWIKSLLNPTNALYWKDLNLYFHWNLSWTLIKTYLTKTHSYRSTGHKKLQKQNNEDFFSQLFYALLHLTNNNNPPPYL